MKNNELLREEFREKFVIDHGIPGWKDSLKLQDSLDEIPDWWLAKLDSLKAELVKRLDDIPEASMKEAHNSSVISREEAIELVKKI